MHYDRLWDVVAPVGNCHSQLSVKYNKVPVYHQPASVPSRSNSKELANSSIILLSLFHKSFLLELSYDSIESNAINLIIYKQCSSLDKNPDLNVEKEHSSRISLSKMY